jgi:hypothetical protein
MKEERQGGSNHRAPDPEFNSQYCQKIKIKKLEPFFL